MAKLNEEMKKQVTLKCLKEIADANVEFVKEYGTEIRRMRDVFEKHLDKLEKVIEDNGYENDVPKVIEAEYNHELEAYEAFVDSVKRNLNSMKLNNIAVYNEIANTMNVTTDILDRLSENFFVKQRNKDLKK